MTVSKAGRRHTPAKPRNVKSVHHVTGRYLHNWPQTYGIEIAGDGFVPTSMPGHHIITRAALDALPEVRAWLGPEADLLIWTYCGFPDMNYVYYGRFRPDDTIVSPRVRYPDTRREWMISHYCGWNPLTRLGRRFSHSPPESCEGFVTHYRKACADADRGRAFDAVRRLGVALHFLEDSGCPAHAARISGALHRPAENLRDPAAVNIAGYRPPARLNAAGLCARLARFAARRGNLLANSLKRENKSAVSAIQAECAIECSRCAADVLVDFYRRYGRRLQFKRRPPRKGVELLHNGSFAAPDDEDICPRGWVMQWWDRHDRTVEITRQRTRSLWNVTARTVGGRVACMTPWPRAIRVRPGETYRLSGNVRSPHAGNGGLYAELYDGATRKLCEILAPSSGSCQCRRLTVTCAITNDQAEILRVGVFAEAAQGPVRFSQLSLIRQ